MKIRIGRIGTVGILSALTLAIGGPAPVEAVTGIVVSFDPLNGIIYEAVPPETLTVQLTVDSAAFDLRGFSLVVEFDSTIVTPISVEPGSLLTSGPCPNYFLTWLNSAAVGDSIAVDGASLGCSVAGPGSIVQMKFVAVPSSFGISPLAWRNGRLRDGVNTALNFKCQDGTIEHQPIVIGVEAESWARVKSLYR